MRWLLLLLLLPGVARADARWNRYQMLMWQDRTPAQLRGLVSIGFTGAKLRGSQGEIDTAGQAALREAGLPWYLENLATDFYSPYHRWFEGKPVTWLFDAAKARRRANPADTSVFIREPGLSDPIWLERIRKRLTAVVRAEVAERPLFYNLADESGIGDLAAAWDADISPSSLAAMRAWLPTQYPDLAALNAQWGTAFAAWDDVVPELTDAALRRTDENFSAWSDFKAFMDVAFAHAVRVGAEAVHGADGAALVALEGGQVPGWGGYDYARLAPFLDVMEIYDYGQSTDLALAFNPALLALRTSFGGGQREDHAVWRHVLHGGRGTIIWDEADNFVSADGSPMLRGLEVVSLLGAIEPVAPLLRQPAPPEVAMFQSQESFRLRWLLDRRAGDHDWTARDAEREYDDNAWRASRRVMVERLAELGVAPRYVTDLRALGGMRVLLLPHAIALSDGDVAAIAAFRAAGGTVLADTEPGLFDAHGRRRAEPPLSGVPHPAALRADGEVSGPAVLDQLAALLVQAGVPVRVTMLGPDFQRATGVEARWFVGTDGPILTLQAMRPFSAPPYVILQFPAAVTIRDIRHPGDMLEGDGVSMKLDGIEPAVLSITGPRP